MERAHRTRDTGTSGPAAVDTQKLGNAGCATVGTLVRDTLVTSLSLLGRRVRRLGLCCLSTWSAVPPAPPAPGLSATTPRHRRDIAARRTARGLIPVRTYCANGYARVGAVSQSGTRRNPVVRTHQPRGVRRGGVRRRALARPRGAVRFAAGPSHDPRATRGRTATHGARPSNRGERRKGRPGHRAALSPGQAGVALIDAQPGRFGTGGGASSASRSTESTVTSSDGRPSR